LIVFSNIQGVDQAELIWTGRSQVRKVMRLDEQWISIAIKLIYCKSWQNRIELISKIGRYQCQRVCYSAIAARQKNSWKRWLYTSQIAISSLLHEQNPIINRISSLIFSI
jgi:hypothetical protein